MADVGLFSWDQPFVRIEFGPPCLSVTPGGSRHDNTLLCKAVCDDLVKASLTFYYKERRNMFQCGRSSICLGPLNLCVWNLQAEK